MYKNFIKRCLDLFFSFLGSIFVVIVCLPVAIAIKLEDGGPVFYNAPRLGKDMKPFKMFKFRSMRVNAPDIRNSDGSTFNGDDDPRVTKVGRFLRKTSIDELPQLWNVLLGDMSFVGPRPSPLGNEARYTEEFKKKFEVLPGITGYNQAVLRNRATMEERIANDIYYVDHISFFLDAKIIGMTICGVFQQKNINRG